MKVWIDDVRHPPDGKWVWFKNSETAIDALRGYRRMGMKVEYISFDHDLGGDDTTRPVVNWMIENEFYADDYNVHSANYVGVEWLEGTIERYLANPERYRQ